MRPRAGGPCIPKVVTLLAIVFLACLSFEPSHLRLQTSGWSQQFVAAFFVDSLVDSFFYIVTRTTRAVRTRGVIVGSVFVCTSAACMWLLGVLGHVFLWRREPLN